MRKLDRYIGLSVFNAIIAVLLVLVGLALLFAFIDELSDIRDGYGLGQVASYVFYTTPRRLYDMLPMAALIGCLVGLGTLASNSELTVMRAAGVSLRRIIWAVMKPMLVVMLAGILIGEYLAPWTEAKAQADRSLALGGSTAQTGGKHGIWHRQGKEYIHINSVQPGGELIGVTRYQFDENQHLLSASFAKRATYQGDHWQLFEVATTEFAPRNTQVKHAAQQIWAVDLEPELLSIVVMSPDALPVSGLWGYAHYLAEQGLNSSRYWLAFWSKVLQPLVTAALVLLAISFIFGPLRSVTLGQRVFTGVLVGFVFKIVQDLLGPSSLVFGFSPLVAVLLPASVCALVGFYLLKRAG